MNNYIFEGFNDEMEKISGLFFDDYTEGMKKKERDLIKERVSPLYRVGQGPIIHSAIGGMLGSSIPEIFGALKQKTWDPKISRSTKIKGGAIGALSVPLLLGLLGKTDYSKNQRKKGQELLLDKAKKIKEKQNLIFLDTDIVLKSKDFEDYLKKSKAPKYFLKAHQGKQINTKQMLSYLIASKYYNNIRKKR